MKGTYNGGFAVRSRSLLRSAALSSCVLATSLSGCSDFTTTRNVPPRGTLGREMFTVLCDRVAAQALPEDVSGASWHPVCHADANGGFATKVDASKLVPLDPNAVDVHGVAVPLSVQQADRAYRIARIEALARDRDRVITALDAAFPASSIPLKDIENADPTRTCDPAGMGPLPRALADVIGRMVPLENDRTVPMLTEALARVLDAVRTDPDSQAALARFDARQGYRPLEIELGAARPIASYPRLVPFARSLLALLAAPGSSGGAPTPPGSAFPQMQQLLRVGREELRTSTTPAPLAPLSTTPDPRVPGRELLSRPRTSLEMTRQLLLHTDPAFDVGLTSPRWLVQRDPRAYAAVPLINGALPAPFVDADHDGLPDVDDLGRFATANGAPVPSPFFAPDGTDGPRDAAGRALAEQGGAPLYGYLDVGQSFSASLEDHLRPLLDPDPMHAHETVMNALRGAYVLFGDRDTTLSTTKQYAPDPHGPAPTQPVTVTYASFHPETSPLLDLYYALGVMESDPAFDDLLQLGKALIVQHPAEVARLVGLGLRVKAIADAHPEAHIPPGSTLWDELLDVIAQIAHVKDGIGGGGILEDLISAFAQDSTLKLQQTFAAYIQYKDPLTYNHNSTTGGLMNALNGPAWNLVSNDTEPLHTPVDRSMPDVGDNRSNFQKFMQVLHDGNGLDICTKQGAVAHVKFNVPPFGTVNFDYPTDALSGAACVVVGASPPPNPMPQCGILRIRNVDALLLDVALGRAQFDIRDPCLKALMNSPLTNIVGGADAFLENQSGIVGFDTHPTVAGVARLVYFDTPHDGMLGDMNPATIQTYDFLKDIIDPAPTMVCDAAPFLDSDGTTVNLRSCKTFDDTIRGRDPGFLFPIEQFDFVANVQGLAAAFDDHKQPLLFVDLFDTLHLHWADAAQPTTVCDPSLPRSDARWCSQDGAVTYEPLLVDILTNTDLFQVLHDTVPIIAATTVTHCDAQDPMTHVCTQSHPLTGVQALANAVRVMVDPALNAGLTDRRGVKTAPRNDGTTNPQVTPIYLFVDALEGVDAAFASWLAAHPGDDRQAAWRSARSQLVDAFFAINGTGAQSSWANPAVPAILPTLTDAMLSQTLAHCPDRLSRAACTYPTTTMVQNMSDTVGGPTFAGTMDVLEAIRADDAARGELEQLLQYMLDPASPGDARAATMTATADILQILNDDLNLTALYHSTADVLGAQTNDAQGNPAARGLADATIQVLARVFAEASDGAGHEVCGQEIDPDAAIPVALAGLVTPIGPGQATPIEVLTDVVADVNRAHPDQTTKLDGGDYANIAKEVSDFCLDPATGLEQVYGVVKQATTGSGN